MAYFVKGDANLGDSIGPQGMNNNSKSHWNRSGHTFDLYEGAYKEGTHWVSLPQPHQRLELLVAARDEIASLHDYSAARSDSAPRRTPDHTSSGTP